ncbi:MAG: ribonuclease E inhibitor RraB [Roseibium sp.]|nr:ribonuclease E inhibitor RraB [Roseibium sp.]
MELLVPFVIAAVGLVVVVIWLLGTKENPRPENLRDDNFQAIYTGQDRGPGSREANDELRRTLQENGLDLSEPLEIDHFAEPGDLTTASTREAFQIALSANRYGDFRFEEDARLLAFSETASLSTMVFDRRTMELNDFLHEHGWIYKGWLKK